MPKKANAGLLPESRWMTQCDVIRYNLKIPQDLKQKLKKEALHKGMDMSTYTVGSCQETSGERKQVNNCGYFSSEFLPSWLR